MYYHYITVLALLFHTQGGGSIDSNHANWHCVCEYDYKLYLLVWKALHGYACILLLTEWMLNLSISSLLYVSKNWTKVYGGSFLLFCGRKASIRTVNRLFGYVFQYYLQLLLHSIFACKCCGYGLALFRTARLHLFSSAPNFARNMDSSTSSALEKKGGVCEAPKEVLQKL